MDPFITEGDESLRGARDKDCHVERALVTPRMLPFLDVIACTVSIQCESFSRPIDKCEKTKARKRAYVDRNIVSPVYASCTIDVSHGPMLKAGDALVSLIIM